MFGKGIKLFTIFGFTVKLDLSWLIIGFLVMWTLAEGVFPELYKDMSVSTYWLMGLGGALGLLLSIVLHELSHSLVARRFGLPMRGITLFVFGGVAEMTDEPPNPKAEFLMALAGPGASVVLGLTLLAFAALWNFLALGEAVAGAVGYLGVINLLLAGFNLLPGFPLDGGRVLRSVLWYWKDNLRWATRVASRIGAGFVTMLIVLGILTFILGGNIIGGVWYFLIGMFLRSAAQSAYQQLLLREALGGETVARFMTENPITVSSNLPLSQLVEEYVYRYHHKLFPVVDDGRLHGCVTTQQIKEIPKQEWPNRTVKDIASECSERNTIHPNADAMRALSRMSRSKVSRLLVVADGELAGLITLKDLLEFFSLKVELEDQDGDMFDIPAMPTQERK